MRQLSTLRLSTRGREAYATPKNWACTALQTSARQHLRVVGRRLGTVQSARPAVRVACTLAQQAQHSGGSGRAWHSKRLPGSPLLPGQAITCQSQNVGQARIRQVQQPEPLSGRQRPRLGAALHGRQQAVAAQRRRRLASSPPLCSGGPSSARSTRHRVVLPLRLPLKSSRGSGRPPENTLGNHRGTAACLDFTTAYAVYETRRRSISSCLAARAARRSRHRSGDATCFTRRATMVIRRNGNRLNVHECFPCRSGVNKPSLTAAAAVENMSETGIEPIELPDSD